MKKKMLAALFAWAFFPCNSCKTRPKPVVSEYNFKILVREKYCNALRLDETLIRETEKEKPYASQQIYFIKRGTTDTLNFPTTVSGELTRKLEAGVYQVFFPEKFAKGPQGHTQKCKEWRMIPDTTITLEPTITNIELRLYRPCSPCNPIRF